MNTWVGAKEPPKGDPLKAWKGDVILLDFWQPWCEPCRNGMPYLVVMQAAFEDFRVVSVEPEEFNYRALRRQIVSMQAKGVDVSDSWVDLHLKLSLPAGSIVMMLLAVPLAVRGTHVSSLPAAVGLGFFVGFSYVIVLAFARALGQNGALPPLLAAWASNGTPSMKRTSRRSANSTVVGSGQVHEVARPG